MKEWLEIHKNKIALAAIFLIAILLYSPTLSHNFTWDDELVIGNNEVTKQGLSGLGEIWTSKSFIKERAIYRPIPQTLFAICWQISPENPMLFHAFSIFVYGLVCLVLLLLLKQLFAGQSIWLLFFISLIFTLHPVHVEVVANVKSLDEMLALLFGLSSFYFFSKALKGARKSYFVSSLFLVLALLSKLNAITFLAVYPLMAMYQMYFIHLKLLDFINPFIKKLIDWFKYLFLLDSNIKLVEEIFLSVVLLSTMVLGLVYLNGWSFYMAVLGLIIILIRTKHEYLFLTVYTLLLFALGWSAVPVIIAGLYYIPMLKKEAWTKDIRFKIIVSILFAGAIFLSEQQFGTIPLTAVFVSIFFTFYKRKFSLSLLVFLVLLPLIFTQELNWISLIALLLIGLIILVNKNYQFAVSTLLICLVAIMIFNQFNNQKLQFSYVPTSYDEVVNFGFTQSALKDNKAPLSPLNNSLFYAANDDVTNASILTIQLKYLELLFVPKDLVHQYGYNQIPLQDFSDWKPWASIGLHSLLLLPAFYGLYKRKAYAFGIIWYFITISIYSNVAILMPDTLADRFLFSPSVGFSIALVLGIYELCLRFNRKMAIALTAILLIPFASYFVYKTIDRSKDWANNFVLAKNTIPNAQDNAAIHAQYATELRKFAAVEPDTEKRKLLYPEIITHYKKALQIYPNFYGANADLGASFISNGQPDSAKVYLSKAAELRPSAIMNHYYLGYIHYDAKDYSAAIDAFNKVLEQGSLLEYAQQLDVASFLARSYFSNGQFDEAKNLLTVSYNNTKEKSLLILLGNMYRERGDVARAVQVFETLLVDYPEDVKIREAIEVLKDQSDL